MSLNCGKIGYLFIYLFLVFLFQRKWVYFCESYPKFIFLNEKLFENILMMIIKIRQWIYTLKL